MHVTLRGNLLATLTEGEILLALARHFQASKVQPPPDFIFSRMLSAYRGYMQDSMSDAWVVNEMAVKQNQITGGAYTLNTMQIGAFVATMKMLKAGDPGADPNESPSWAEAYDMSGLSSIPWGTLALTAGGVLLLYGFASGLGKGLVSK